VCIEDLYHQRGLLVRRFPLRGNSIVHASFNTPGLMVMYDALASTNATPPPIAPKSQPLASRELQETENRIGSVLERIVQAPQASGMSSTTSSDFPTAICSYTVSVMTTSSLPGSATEPPPTTDAIACKFGSRIISVPQTH